MFKGRAYTVVVIVSLLALGVLLGLSAAAIIQSFSTPTPLVGWESLLGSVLGAVGTVFAGYLAWAAVRLQIETESSDMKVQLRLASLQSAAASREILKARLEVYRKEADKLQESLEAVRAYLIQSYSSKTSGVVVRENVPASADYVWLIDGSFDTFRAVAFDHNKVESILAEFISACSDAGAYIDDVIHDSPKDAVTGFVIDAPDLFGSAKFQEFTKKSKELKICIKEDIALIERRLLDIDRLLLESDLRHA